MAWGNYAVDFAWASVPPSPDYRGWLLGIDAYSRLGTSTYLGWSAIPGGGVWTPEWTRTRRVSISRGRDNELDQINPANVSLLMNNEDGHFSPDLWPNIEPMKVGRVTCTYGATTGGSGATDRATTVFAGYTWIDAGNPIAYPGRLTSFSIWANIDLAGCEVATFYQTAPNTFSTRDTDTIGAVPAGSKQTFVVDLECEIGDYLGIFFDPTGQLDAVAGGAGCWYCVGDQIPCIATAFTSYNRTISIEATGTAIFPLAYFLIDRILPHPRLDQQDCEIRCTDALTWIEMHKATHTYTGLGMGALIAEALDLAEWPPPLRDLDTGALAGITATYTDAPILSGHILAALQSERGIVYVGNDGHVKYEDRHHRYKGSHLAPLSVINATMADFMPELGAADIKNAVSVSYASGGTVSRTDGYSRVHYGPRDLAIDGTLLGLGDATSLAEWLLSRHKDPHSRPRLVLQNGTAANYVAMLAREISDRITVIEPKTGVSADFFIERIEHEIGDMSHETTWTLSHVDANQYWLLGRTGYSNLGLSTKLGY